MRFLIKRWSCSTIVLQIGDSSHPPMSSGGELPGRFFALGYVPKTLRTVAYAECPSKALPDPDFPLNNLQVLVLAGNDPVMNSSFARYTLGTTVGKVSRTLAQRWRTRGEKT